MRKFILTVPFLQKILNKEEATLLVDFFKDKKYIDSENAFTIRYFMFYQNYFLELPEVLEEKRVEIFTHLYNVGYEEADFLQSKTEFRKKPVGYKD